MCDNGLPYYLTANPPASTVIFFPEGERAIAQTNTRDQTWTTRVQDVVFQASV